MMSCCWDWGNDAAWTGFGLGPAALGCCGYAFASEMAIQSGTVCGSEVRDSIDLSELPQMDCLICSSSHKRGRTWTFGNSMNHEHNARLNVLFDSSTPFHLCNFRSDIIFHQHSPIPMLLSFYLNVLHRFWS